jgi:hypothetical protein
MLGAHTTVTPFHHQPEAQHPKSSDIHKNARPITPSFGVSAGIALKNTHASLTQRGHRCRLLDLILIKGFLGTHFFALNS